jgi:hypothetical protein
MFDVPMIRYEPYHLDKYELNGKAGTREQLDARI